MENFVFQNATKVIFGRGTEELVGEEASGAPRRRRCSTGGKKRTVS